MPEIAVKTRDCSVVDLGLLDYLKAWDLQKKIFQDRRDGKTGDILLLLQHPHTYTIGKSGKAEHLLVSREALADKGIFVYDIDRGGDITYHGPGQLVGYPIISLTENKLSISDYVRNLEEVIIITMAEYGVEAGRIKGLTGVWLGNSKIAAIGVKVSHWLTMHGFALNVNTDLEYFNYITPCGIKDKGVTSLSRIMGKQVESGEVAKKTVENFGKVFNMEMKWGALGNG